MNKQLAQLIVNLIPATCPFNKSFKFAGFSVTIPSLCKLNPFYYQLVELRVRALDELTNDNYDAIGDTVDGVSASEDKVFINLTNSTLSYSYEFYSLSKGMLSRPLTDILGKRIIGIISDDKEIVVKFTDYYSLLIKLV